MTLTPDGGPALPVSVTTTRKAQGGSAIPVYGYMTAPTDGRPSLGGAALPVRVLTAADLKQNGGQWTLEGRPHAMPVYTAPATARVMGGPALAVYPVNAWPTATPPATPWYLAGGLALSDIRAAYKAKGAASLAASYTNLANPGTNDAAPGVAPTFNAATGRTYNGTTQYLTTGLVMTWGDSLFIRVSGLNLVAYGYLCGGYDSGWYNVGFTTGNAGSNINGVYGENKYPISASAISGVLGITPNSLYLDGVPVAGLTSRDWAGHGATPRAIFIGCDDNAGSPADYAAFNEQAYLHIGKTVSDAEALAISNAMAAL